MAQAEYEQAHAAQAADQAGSGSLAHLAAVYDPLDLYTRLAREFHWPDRDFDEMDYVRFFGYVDRLSRQQQRERDEAPGAGSALTPGLPAEIVEAEAVAAVAAFAPEPRVYTGRTVPYVG